MIRYLTRVGDAVALPRWLRSIALATAVVLASPLSAFAADAESSGRQDPATIQPVEDSVWKVLTDGAGNRFGASSTITIDRDGQVIVCCSDARVDGEEVSQAVRFGGAEPVLSLEPYGAVSYPFELRLDDAGVFWVTGQGSIASHDEAGWTTQRPSKDRGVFIGDVIGFGVDGSVWTSASDDRPAVASFTDGAWTVFDDAAGLPRLTARWSGGISAIEGTADGSTWVAVSAQDRVKPGGLLRFDGTAWHVEWPLGKGTRARVEGLTIDHEGRLWAYLSTVAKGEPVASYLASFDGSDWSTYDQADGVPAAGPYDDTTRMIVESAPDGAIWLTTRGGFECARLAVFDGAGSSRYMETACIKDLTITPDGAVWVSAEWLTNYGAEQYDDGIYVITPGASEPYPPGATVVAAPEAADGPIAQLGDEYLRDCEISAASVDERRMCALIAPIVEDAIRAAVDTCGGEDPEGDGDGMCLAFIAPMVASSMLPPPWRDTTDVDTAAAYLELIARHMVLDDESQAAWGALATNSLAFAESLRALVVPEHAEVIAADTAERLVLLAAAEQALAATPDDVRAMEDYRSAVAAAAASDTELRWALGLPPPAAVVMQDRDAGYDFFFDTEPAPAIDAMTRRRTGHSATRLNDGRVLLLGGDASGEATSDAEVFDPTSESFEHVPSMPKPRTLHHASAMPDGRVFVVGGKDRQWDAAQGALLFDPVSGASESVPGLGKFFRIDVVEPLEDGRVLVVGPGNESAALGAVYDPGTGAFVSSESPIEGRDGGTATYLADGTVLLLGGVGDYYADASIDAEVFDPGSGASTVAEPPIHLRSMHTATLLHDGTVLIAGGSTGLAVLASATIFDPESRTFGAVGSLTGPRSGHTATLLQDGRVLLAGGHSGIDPFDSEASAEIYDPLGQRFVRTGAMVQGRSGHSATLLDDGRVLIAGGENQADVLASAELYDPSTGTFRTIAPERPLGGDMRTGHSP